MPTWVASSPSRVCGARRAPAALLSHKNSTLPGLRRLGCLVLGVNAAPMPQDVPTREGVVSSVFAALGIERVTETVTKECEAQHGEPDRHHREEQHVRTGLDIPGFASFSDHLTPTGLGWPDSDADVAERRLNENCGRNTKCQRYDDRREAVRQHMPADNVGSLSPRDLRGADVFL